jgi:hypothetical protein
VTTPFNEQRSAAEPVRLVAHDGTVMLPDDEGLSVYFDVDDGARSIMFGESELAPGPPPRVEEPYRVHVSERWADGEGHCYGGVVSVSLQAEVLALTFTAEAAAELGFPSPDVQIALELEPSTVDSVRRALRVVFESGPQEFRPKRIDLD